MADFYETLGVARTATDDEIKQAYRRLATKYHPDKNGGSKEAEEQFKLVTEAYDTLRDPKKRAAYDRYGEAGARGMGGGAGFHHVDLGEALEIFMRDFGLGDLFGGAMRGGGGGGARAGADVKLEVRLTLEEVATGVTRTAKVRLQDPCEPCGGSGAEAGSKPTACATCGGVGEVRRAQRSFFGQFVSVMPCPTCQGEGQTIGSPCKACKGEGRVRGEHTIPIKVPPGVASGQYMQMRGIGNAGPRGGPRGDLVVFFEVEEDDRFERDGEDLYTELLVTWPQLVLGDELEVPGVLAPIPLSIPPGTQSGHVFVLPRQGLPRVNASGVGDLHVRVQVWIPEEPSKELRALAKKVAAAHEPPPSKRSKGFWARMKDALGAS